MTILSNAACSDGETLPNMVYVDWSKSLISPQYVAPYSLYILVSHRSKLTFTFLLSWLIGAEHIISGDTPKSESRLMGLNDMFSPAVSMSKNPAVAAENCPPTMKGIATDATIHKLLPSLLFLIPDLPAFVPLTDFVSKSMISVRSKYVSIAATGAPP